MGTYAISVDPDEMRTMRISSGCALFARIKPIFRERNAIIFLKIITGDP